MAGDWIKVRVWLSRDPRVITMADTLAADRVFMDWFKTHEMSRDSHVTRHVTVALCVTSLIVTWGVAREQGNRNGDDLVISHADLSTLDGMTEVPGFGAAMGAVGWAIEQEDGSLCFPKFFRENESPDERHRRQAAERQARLRMRSTQKSNVTVTRDGNVTVTHREEKRREENNNNPLPPSSSKAKPPALDEWLKYGNELGMTEAEATDAFDHYKGCGWVIGKARKPMKDWKAVCRTAARKAKSWRNDGAPTLSMAAVDHSGGF